MPSPRQQDAADEMRRHVRDLSESGLSVREYCELTGLSASRLYRWRRRVSSEPAVRTPPAEFVAVTVVPDEAPRAPLIVELGSGRRVGVPERFSEEALRQVIRVLESC